MRKFLTGAITMIIVTVLAVSMPMRTFAAGRKTYISDITVASASSVAAARKLLTKAGYTAIPSDVNPDNSGVVCIGYKTTTNKDEAITDIAVMNMNGGYSYEDYDHVLEEYKDVADNLVDEIYDAVSEYRDNYKAGQYNALLAYAMLNRFYDEDFGTENNLLGDILLSDDLTKDQLSVIFMQASALAVNTIEYCLAVGCSDNWLDRFLNMPANTSYTTEDDDNARKIYQSFASFQKSMNEYAEIVEASGLTMDSTEEEWSAYYDSLTEDQQSIVDNNANTYDYLRTVEYKNGTLYDFFMQDLNEIDNADLYPLARAMTAGQIATVNYASLGLTIQYSIFTDEMMKVMLDSVNTETDYETVSIFDGVDRSIFSSDGIALTNEAMRQATSTSDYSWSKGNLSDEAEAAFYGIMGTASCIAVAGMAVWAVASAKLSTLTTVAYQTAFSTLKFTRYLPSWFVDVKNGETVAQALANAEAEDFVYVLKKTGIAKAERFAEAVGDSSIWKSVTGVSKIVTAVALAVVLITLVIYLVMEYKAYNKKKNYSNIPRLMVDQTTAADGTRKYTYYYAAKDTNGEYADLNNWCGNEWNALYYTKDADAGDPITPSALVSEEGIASDSSYNMSVHAFGSTAAYNLNRFSKNQESGIYLFFKTDDGSSLAGTAMTYGGYALVAVIGAAIGAVGMFFIDRHLSKKKKAIPSES